MAINNNPSDSNLGGVHGRGATPEEIAKRDGYVQGRTDENYVQRNVRSQERIAAQAAADNNAVSGLLVGMIIALLAAGVGAALYFLTGDRSNVVPVEVPQIDREKETIIEKETTIIEREAPTPDVSLPDVQVDTPDVNIVNESPEPVAEPEPVAAPEPVTEPEPAAESAPDAQTAE